ncbi:helix-turn-helix transcriptional regulator [Nitrosomonas ureae]|uniref:Transcriptional regulator, AlpA family n=1 Tax=Nitrosomonas ureae TaxID=44577 RepID=A0A1H5T0R2_9PROT|nr:AlpA family phage regulatory protein [Nitrosomonas ureae]SEF56369.1 transcriptional regulator, AlpA family [Nitrosomonas ureae]
MNQTISTPQHQLQQKKHQSTSQLERLLYLAEVEFQTGFKTSFLYQLMKEGKFPKPVKIGNASRWRESEVQQWIHDQINVASSKHPKA